MAQSASRRTFLKSTAVTGVGVWAAGGVAPRESRAANEKIQFACIGVGGKGASDSADAGQAGDVVAICDIDGDTLTKSAERFTSAAKFSDFREMLDKLGDKIDAVTVSTPDHTHAAAASMAMSMGKHCFCQKPLTHSIFEARRLGELAKEKGVVTQMGNQGTAENGVRRAAALIKAGAIGTPKEVHVWTNRPVWPQGVVATPAEAVPATLNWDAFIGPAQFREYSSAYHPFKWRGFWDFGTGALGDMACHTLNMPYMGVDLMNPTSVQATTAGHNKITYPAYSVITFEFPANNWRGPVKLFWYDGGKLPKPELLSGAKLGPNASGCLVVGDKGTLYSPNDYGAEFELIGGTDSDVKFTRSPGHFREFAMGIKGGPMPRSNFAEYAGPLTEVILLGNLAVWAADGTDTEGPKVEWDAKNLAVKGTNEFDSIVKREYRDGWKLF
jgi:predicted dehydrogenase